MKIDKLLQDFLFHCKFEKNLNPKTIAAYTMDIEQFKTFKNIKSMDINEVKQLKIKDINTIFEKEELIIVAKIGLNRTTMQELDRTQKRSLTGQ